MRRAIVAIVTTAAGTVVLLGAKGALGLAVPPQAAAPAVDSGASTAPSTAASAAPVPNQPMPTATKPAPTGNTGGGGNNNPPAPPPAPDRMRDGTWRGRDVSAGRYGSVQLEIRVAAGKMTAVAAIKKPGGEPRTEDVTDRAIDIMTAQALREQTADVDTVTGATETCEAYAESLQSAMDKAYGA